MTIAARTAGLALFVMLGPVAAQAATEANFTASTTGDLVELCDAKPDSPLASAAINFCLGFAQGAVSVEMQHDAGSRSMKLFCLPAPLPSRLDTMSGFVKWARASPDRLNGLPSDGLFRFLGERFPCPGGH